MYSRQLVVIERSSQRCEELLTAASWPWPMGHSATVPQCQNQNTMDSDIEEQQQQLFTKVDGLLKKRQMRKAGKVLDERT